MSVACPGFAGRTVDADQWRRDVDGDSVAGQVSGLVDHRAGAGGRIGDLEGQVELHLRQRRVGAVDGRVAGSGARLNACLAPLLVGLGFTGFFGLLALLGCNALGLCHDAAYVGRVDGHRTKERAPEAHGGGNEARAEAADQAAHFFGEVAQNCIRDGHVQAVLHDVDRFQGVVVEQQPADGRG